MSFLFKYKYIFFLFYFALSACSEIDGVGESKVNTNKEISNKLDQADNKGIVLIDDNLPLLLDSNSINS